MDVRRRTCTEEVGAPLMRTSQQAEQGAFAPALPRTDPVRVHDHIPRR
jgi:hypothetical protein